MTTHIEHNLFSSGTYRYACALVENSEKNRKNLRTLAKKKPVPFHDFSKLIAQMPVKTPGIDDDNFITLLFKEKIDTFPYPTHISGIFNPALLDDKNVKHIENMMDRYFIAATEAYKVRLCSGLRWHHSSDISDTAARDAMKCLLTYAHAHATNKRDIMQTAGDTFKTIRTYHYEFSAEAVDLCKTVFSHLKEPTTGWRWQTDLFSDDEQEKYFPQQMKP